MGPLLACACALWYGLGERMLILGRRFGGDIPARVRGGDTPKGGIMAEAWRVLRSNAQLHLSEPDQRARFDEALRRTYIAAKVPSYGQERRHHRATRRPTRHGLWHD